MIEIINVFQNAGYILYFAEIQSLKHLWTLVIYLVKITVSIKNNYFKVGYYISL